MLSRYFASKAIAQTSKKETGEKRRAVLGIGLTKSARKGAQRYLRKDDSLFRGTYSLSQKLA